MGGIVITFRLPSAITFPVLFKVTVSLFGMSILSLQPCASVLAHVRLNAEWRSHAPSGV